MVSKKYVIHHKWSPLFVFVFLLAIAVCTLQGQTANNKTTPSKDYSLWGKLAFSKISSDGKWIASRMIYKQQRDTLIIINTENKQQIKKANCLDLEFSPNGKWLMTFAIDKGIDLIQLSTQNSRNFDSRSYEFSNNTDKMGILDSANSFFLIDLEKNNTIKIENAKEFTFAPNGSWLAMVTEVDQEQKVELLNTETLKRTTLIKSAKNVFSNLVWNEQSNALAFMETEKDIDGRIINTILYEYSHRSSPKLNSLYAKEKINFPANTYISTTDDLFYSADGNRIFFNVRPSSYRSYNRDSLNNNVQIWKGDDPKVVPQQLKLQNPSFGPWLMQWRPKDKNLLQIGSLEYPISYLSAQESYALIFNPKQYELNNEQKGKVDIYLKDLTTGEQKLFLEKQPNSFGNLLNSHSGRYIAYYKMGNWWIYDTYKESHTNITINLPFKRDEHKDSFANIPEIYGCAGMDASEKWVFIYDEFDIWMITHDGRECHKITNGRDSQTTYRIYNSPYDPFLFQRFSKFPVQQVQLNDEVVLSASDPNGSGYFFWSRKEGIKPLVWKESKIDNLIKSKNTNVFIFEEESFNIPDRLFVKRDEQDPELIYESNPQHINFATPKQEMIHYKGPENKDLQGILMYPENYVEGKQYPMVVHIYEKQSQKFHDYITPTLLNPNGFNPRLLTAQDYFVLYPDIGYKMKEPGISATTCVNNAVKKVLESNRIDKKRIGLYGHSFGGYEAAFIATQTNIFATIIAGAPITDLTSMYLSIGNSDGRPDLYRFENQQFRFGCSFFEDPEAYFNNSPVHQAEKINTPILLWAGADDAIVNVNQSIELYLALRRLDKEVTFLYYPNEYHHLSTPKNQQHLTLMILEWWDKYLKN